MHWLRKLLGTSGANQLSAEVNAPVSLPGLPFPALVVPGRHALAIRASRIEPGIVPVILGPVSELGRITELIERDELTTEDYLHSATTIDARKWCRRTAEADPEAFQVDAGSWPWRPERFELTAHKQLVKGAFHPEVVITLVPSERSWQVPARLHYGGWNDCPEPAVHVALHRHWNERYGAEIACASADVIECTVKRRPESKDEALELAREMFVYCPDLIHQGMGTLAALAAGLMVSDCWYFWWD